MPLQKIPARRPGRMVQQLQETSMKPFGLGEVVMSGSPHKAVRVSAQAHKLGSQGCQDPVPPVQLWARYSASLQLALAWS